MMKSRDAQTYIQNTVVDMPNRVPTKLTSAIKKMVLAFRCYLVMVPQAMRAPEFPDGSVKRSSRVRFLDTLIET